MLKKSAEINNLKKKKALWELERRFLVEKITEAEAAAKKVQSVPEETPEKLPAKKTKAAKPQNKKRKKAEGKTDAEDKKEKKKAKKEKPATQSRLLFSEVATTDPFTALGITPTTASSASANQTSAAQQASLMQSQYLSSYGWNPSSQYSQSYNQQLLNYQRQAKQYSDYYAAYYQQQAQQGQPQQVQQGQQGQPQQATALSSSGQKPLTPVQQQQLAQQQQQYYLMLQQQQQFQTRSPQQATQQSPSQ
jgi:hypothetical protein